VVHFIAQMVNHE